MTTTPHDALFKAIFSAPRRAAELLRSLLSPGTDVIERLIHYILNVRGAEEFLGLDIQRLGLGRTSEAIMETREEYLLRKGREDGFEKGLEKGRRELFLDLLRTRFPQLTLAVVDRVEAADGVSLGRWSARLLVAATLDEVFDSTH